MNARQARRNAISAQLASLDVAAAPVSKVNGLIHEELLAANSMILHELDFEDLAGASPSSSDSKPGWCSPGAGAPVAPASEPRTLVHTQSFPSLRNTAAKTATTLPRLLSPRRAAEVGQGC